MIIRCNMFSKESKFSESIFDSYKDKMPLVSIGMFLGSAGAAAVAAIYSHSNTALENVFMMMGSVLGGAILGAVVVVAAIKLYERAMDAKEEAKNGDQQESAAVRS